MDKFEPGSIPFYHSNEIVNEAGKKVVARINKITHDPVMRLIGNRIEQPMKRFYFRELTPMIKERIEENVYTIQS